MAVHVPLGNAAVLEAQTINAFFSQYFKSTNGAPMALPSQDMVLGLYYITKGRKSEKGHPMKGEGKHFIALMKSLLLSTTSKLTYTLGLK
jgi:DNA-directed RNA polymerase subunit beta'